MESEDNQKKVSEETQRMAKLQAEQSMKTRLLASRLGALQEKMHEKIAIEKIKNEQNQQNDD